MRKFYLLMLLLLIGMHNATAQTSCNQAYGGVGGLSIPITGGDQANIAAVDLAVNANTNFTLNQIEVNFMSESFPFSFTFTTNFYKGELGNLIGNRDLSIAGIQSTTSGIWKITFNLSNPIVLSGGPVGSKYWLGITATPSENEEIYWASTPYTEENNLPIFHSGDGGTTWTSIIEGVSGLAEGSIKAIGTCEEVQNSVCSQNVPSYNFESGSNINGNWSRAVDLITKPNQDFLLKQIELNVQTSSPISFVNIYYYEDNNGLPGQLVGQQTNVLPTTDIVIQPDRIPGYDVRKITLEIENVLFTGKVGEEKHYWVRLNAENITGEPIWWETTFTTSLGYKMANYFNNEWSILLADEGVYEFRGECINQNMEENCGTTFTDSGGISENYGNNENKTWHIIPESDKVSSVEFTSFATEEGFDGLMVYDGPDTTYPIISSGFTSGNTTCPNGAWTGSGIYSANGRAFISTHSSGMLTFVFTSNDTNSDSGWQANITCLEPGSAGNCLSGNIQTSFAVNSTGLGAHMFNVTSLSSKDMEIRKFDIHMKYGKKDIKVYYKLGGYEGYENDPNEWTLLGSQITTGKGQGKITELKIGGLIIPAGETCGIYITMSDYVLGEGITFPINSIDHNTYSNNKLKITPGLMMPGGYFDHELYYENTVWEGTIYYCEGGEDQTYQQPCLNAEYGQYPSYIYEPGFYGYPEPITSTGWRGEYSLVKVTAGSQYVFSSSSNTDFITLSDELGIVPLISGTGSVTWTSNKNGVVRFYTHTNDQCGMDNSNPITRYIKCGETYVPQVPNFSCYFGDGLSGNLPPQAGSSIQYEGYYAAADDFIIESENFSAKQIRLNVFSDTPITEGRFNFYHHVFYDELEGPDYESFITTPFLVPSQQIALANIGEKTKVYELTFDFPEGIDFPEGHYWISPEIKGNNTYWEVSSTGSTGHYVHSGEGSWIPYEGMQAVFFISGECDLMGSNEIKSPITYYPNPVENILNLKTMKKIELVEIFGITGQKVLEKSSLKNQQLDLSSLPSGVYLIYIQMENGAKETFKIIKK